MVCPRITFSDIIRECGFFLGFRFSDMCPVLGFRFYEMWNNMVCPRISFDFSEMWPVLGFRFSEMRNNVVCPRISFSDR